MNPQEEKSLEKAILWGDAADEQSLFPEQATIRTQKQMPVQAVGLALLPATHEHWGAFLQDYKWQTQWGEGAQRVGGSIIS